MDGMLRSVVAPSHVNMTTVKHTSHRLAEAQVDHLERKLKSNTASRAHAHQEKMCVYGLRSHSCNAEHNIARCNKHGLCVCMYAANT